jgi:hypothetical protein
LKHVCLHTSVAQMRVYSWSADSPPGSEPKRFALDRNLHTQAGIRVATSSRMIALLLCAHKLDQHIPLRGDSPTTLTNQAWPVLLDKHLAGTANSRCPTIQTGIEQCCAHSDAWRGAARLWAVRSQLGDQGDRGSRMLQARM